MSCSVGLQCLTNLNSLTASTSPAPLPLLTLDTSVLGPVVTVTRGVVYAWCNGSIPSAQSKCSCGLDTA